MAASAVCIRNYSMRSKPARRLRLRSMILYLHGFVPHRSLTARVMQQHMQELGDAHEFFARAVAVTSRGTIAQAKPSLPN
jgi:hypothetical protein